MNDPAAPQLVGRTALVTGAGRGLGRAYALALAGQGADVAMLDLDLRSYRDFEAEQAQMTADMTADEVRSLGRRALEFEVDVTDASAVRDSVQSVYAQWGRLDVVVCNAGGGIGRPRQTRASTMDLGVFEEVLRRNLHGTVHTCMAAAEVMRRQGSGKIITVSSRAGLQANPDGNYAHYGTAKAAVIMYTKYLAQDLGPDGITVNCIAPGSIGTGRLAPMLARQGDALTDSIGLRRIGTPEDCAGVVAFLAGPASDYLNGAVIPIDGGIL